MRGLRREMDRISSCQYAGFPLKMHLDRAGQYEGESLSVVTYRLRTTSPSGGDRHEYWGQNAPIPVKTECLERGVRSASA